LVAFRGDRMADYVKSYIMKINYVTKWKFMKVEVGGFCFQVVATEAITPLKSIKNLFWIGNQIVKS
jgi:hypothetical protein